MRAATASSRSPTGGAEFAPARRSRTWSPARSRFAEFAHVVADEVPGHRRAAHRPLPEGQARHATSGRCWRISQERVAAGKNPLFQSHMWDGSAVPIDENLDDRRRSCSSRPRPGQDHPRDRDRRGRRRGGRRRRTRSTTSSTPPPRTSRRPSTRSAPASTARYLLAATFGNVHGVYKPGNVKLRPDILEQGQKVAGGRSSDCPRAQAVRPRLPRRLRLAAVGDRGLARATAW